MKWNVVCRRTWWHQTSSQRSPYARFVVIVFLLSGYVYIMMHKSLTHKADHPANATTGHLYTLGASYLNKTGNFNTLGASSLHKTGDLITRGASYLHKTGDLNTHTASYLHKTGDLNTREASYLHKTGDLNTREASYLHKTGDLNTRGASYLHKTGDLNTREASYLLKTGDLNTREASYLHKTGDLNTRGASYLHKTGDLNTHTASYLHKTGDLNTRGASYLHKTGDLNTHGASYVHLNDTNKNLGVHGKLRNFRGYSIVNHTSGMTIGERRRFIKDDDVKTMMSKKSENYTLNKQQYFNRDMRVKDINCLAIINGDMNEIAIADELDKTKPKVPYSAESYIDWTSNCSNFINDRGYIMDPLTEEERHFSVAFSILMYKDVEQTERLLRAIYRPQHLFCIHVDSKTHESIYEAMINIAGCFENVFILEKRYNVKWGTMTVLKPDLSCMEALWNRSKTWKYFINLTGQEFPLRTNSELVQILQAYKGANDVAIAVNRSRANRWEEAGPPPHSIVVKKGSVHITASRGFVDFVLHDQRAQDFLNWTNKTEIPDETFYTSLNYNPFLDVPGSYKETDMTDDTKPTFVSRFKRWGTSVSCYGKVVRSICVFGTGDLPQLASRRELFANKFFLNYQHYALDCIEELHYNRTRDEYLGKLEFDAQWYSQLEFVYKKAIS